ncbi:7-cyano-7-deazaguanine synthase QueC [Frankia sp. Cr1]|uniref:7-cyano-7-deazaguanine synthase QueC n=1 Tax=Frankia sp. Cr1 TaxID=3073931 RepID=UPI003A0FD7C7
MEMTPISTEFCPPTAVVIISGGLDSSTLAYHFQAGGSRLMLLSFDYGQRHRRELDAAAIVAAGLGARHHIVDVQSVGALLAGSAITDSYVEVPDGHYTDETMKITVVPNRNALMLDVAIAVAVVEQADAVAFGAHAGDHTIYPDCRPEFIDALQVCARVGNDGFLADGFRILAPFLTWSKAEIVRRGAELGVPFGETWSCYKGGAVHCGRCGTCTERREAFALAGVPDPTVYAAG